MGLSGSSLMTRSRNCCLKHCWIWRGLFMRFLNQETKRSLTLKIWAGLLTSPWTVLSIWTWEKLTKPTLRCSMRETSTTIYFTRWTNWPADTSSQAHFVLKVDKEYKESCDNDGEYCRFHNDIMTLLRLKWTDCKNHQNSFFRDQATEEWFNLYGSGLGEAEVE